MNISDIIASAILDIMSESSGVAEIQRNELASQIGCVPSQINYVITSRFTPEQGYIVESRRGGKGYIRITRANLNNQQTVMHIVNSIGESLDEYTARVILDNLAYQGILEDGVHRFLSVALSDKALRAVEGETRDKVRADLFKNLMLCLL
ncbi:CtsR family transcriptional regulator [Akkermansia muciniphila]|uniref:CtsR family transcriptional regulator n=1 Tax=Akkermansia muciniphila TaxID=239935 RepID=UPI00122F3D46|nr:CtsR family transcriptional regulator [Akkermansia muciniphila]KAA3380109.1 CtsR family transcriptional regulator [Akkermansia muciniphila]